MNASAQPAPPAEAPIAPSTPVSPQKAAFDPLLSLGSPGSNASPSTQQNRMAQMQAIAYQQNMMMMQQQMQQMQMAYAGGGAGGNFVRQGSGSGVPPMPNARPNVMGANYMRQVPGVQGDKMSSFSFLGSDSKKKDDKSFDFVMDAMKKG